MDFYILKMKGTNYYKYGLTIDLEHRLSLYKTHNPVNMEIHYLEQNLRECSVRNLEREISKDEDLRLNRVKGRKEWLELNEVEITELTERIKAYNNGERKRFEDIRKQGKIIYVDHHIFNKWTGKVIKGERAVLEGKDGEIYELY